MLIINHLSGRFRAWIQHCGWQGEPPHCWRSWHIYY